MDASNGTSVLPAYITASVAVIVALISFQQWRVAREKLKLDLYVKRFAIYNAALSYYQMSFYSSDAQQVESARQSFVRDVRASRFLFDLDNGIFETLEEFQKEMNKRVDVAVERKKGENANREILRTFAHYAAESLQKTEALLLTLEAKIHPYIGFQTPSVWRIWERWLHIFS